LLLTRHLGAETLDGVFPGHSATPERFVGAIRA
jgi:hypothetical protein